MEKIELLSPAGDMERLKITLLYGADAVYMGGYKFSMRANAVNFTKEEIKEACDFAHRINKKVYITINIVFHNNEIREIEEYIDEVASLGVDAIIISDPSLIEYIHKRHPEIEIHFSTQSSTINYEAMNFLKEQGVKRIVPARELSKKELQEIVRKTNMDIEVFIHGSMCTFYSGRCTLSNYLTNRDANRGGCAQVCRFAFNIENNQTKFTMATKDLNMSRYIGDLIEIGIRSLKVEGRMRTVYYLATVISSYRRIIDNLYNNTMTDEIIAREEQILSRVANRETSSHYFSHQADETDQYYTGRQELSNQDYLAIVNDYDKERKQIVIIERNYFKVGDKVDLFTPEGKLYTFTVDKIIDSNMEETDVARHPNEVLRLNFDIEVPKYSMIRKSLY